jgi:hypothetical protein
VPVAAALEHRLPSCRRWLWNFIHTLWSILAIREKSLALDPWAGDGGDYVLTFLEASSWRPCLAAGACFPHLQVGGCRGSGPEEMLLVRRGGDLGNHGWQHLHEVGELLGLAWVTILCH